MTLPSLSRVPSNCLPIVPMREIARFENPFESPFKKFIRFSSATASSRSSSTSIIAAFHCWTHINLQVKVRESSTDDPSWSQMNETWLTAVTLLIAKNKVRKFIMRFSAFYLQMYRRAYLKHERVCKTQGRHPERLWDGLGNSDFRNDDEVITVRMNNLSVVLKIKFEFHIMK